MNFYDIGNCLSALGDVVLPAIICGKQKKGIPTASVSPFLKVSDVYS